MTIAEVHFKEEELDDEPKPLKMEHFYFPLGVLLVGILLSVFCFVVEIIFHCLRRSKTDVPLEEPGVAQSTPESEDRHNSDVEDSEDTKLHTNLVKINE